MGWFDWLKPKEDWVLVRTYYIDVTVTHGVTGLQEEGKLNFYLYETCDGKRRVEHKHSVGGTSDNFNAVETYTQIIYPWLQGMNYADIPSFWDVREGQNKEYVQQMYIRLLRGQ